MSSLDTQWELTSAISISVASLDRISSPAIRMKQALERKSFVRHYKKYKSGLMEHLGEFVR